MGTALSPLDRFTLCRMATGTTAALERFEFINFSGASGGSYLPNIGKGAP
jgi:hypothetical protein